jgi:hypothetical protein
MLSNDNDKLAEASKALANGLVKVCKETNALPREFSASFLLYRLKVDPELVVSDLCTIVHTAIESFNSLQKLYTATYNLDGPDVLITIQKSVTD